VLFENPSVNQRWRLAPFCVNMSHLLPNVNMMAAKREGESVSKTQSYTGPLPMRSNPSTWLSEKSRRAIPLLSGNGFSASGTVLHVPYRPTGSGIQGHDLEPSSQCLDVDRVQA